MFLDFFCDFANLIQRELLLCDLVVQKLALRLRQADFLNDSINFLDIKLPSHIPNRLVRAQSTAPCRIFSDTCGILSKVRPVRCCLEGNIPLHCLHLLTALHSVARLYHAALSQKSQVHFTQLQSEVYPCR